jgi:hypothetical protein
MRYEYLEGKLELLEEQFVFITLPKVSTSQRRWQA